MAELEKDIEKAFVDHCRKMGLKALKLRVDGQNGFPDRTVFTVKGPILFEFKRPKGTLRSMQNRWLLWLESLGVKVVTPRKVGEAEKALMEFLKDG